METLHITTTHREELVSITSQVAHCITAHHWESGAILIFCPHTTGAITINEGADPDVVRDILVNMRSLLPHTGDYLHAEGNSDAHIKSSLFGCEQLVIVEQGHLQLGTWQKIYFCEFDGPRTRKIWLQFLANNQQK